jgi:hypothetical protein
MYQSCKICGRKRRLNEFRMCGECTGVSLLEPI